MALIPGGAVQLGFLEIGICLMGFQDFELKLEPRVAQSVLETTFLLRDSEIPDLGIL